MLTLLACAPNLGFLDEPPAAVSAHPAAIVLGISQQADHLSVPTSSRPEPVGDRFRATAPFVLAGTLEDGSTVWRVPLPVHANLLPTRLKGTHVFGTGEPPGFEVWYEGMRHTFTRNGRAPRGWGFDRRWLYVGVAAGRPAPDWQQVEFRFPKAAEAERALNFDTAGLGSADFVNRTLTLGEQSWTGLLLPAPSVASWTLEWGEGAVFDADTFLVPPAILPAAGSDGADLVVRVDGIEVARTTIGVHVARFRCVLPGSGRHSLELLTEPKGSSDFDYVFVSGPAVYVPTATPQRVLLVFVDTLRRDRVGVYGYEGGTTPLLDRLAAHGTVFESARSVSPWTLPAVRAAMSGTQPELWGTVPTLPARLAAGGFQTEAIVGNAFLSQPFDAQRGWTHYEYSHLLEPDDVVARARAVLDRYPDRDLALLVHFMGPHMPYDEPPWYTWWFAGQEPVEIKQLSRDWLSEVPWDSPNLDVIRDYVSGRYDANVRWVNDELGPLIADVGATGHVVVFADHGEELWDHGGFEHGHTFYDELLAVPLLVRSASMLPGRVDAPVSLLDLTPTVLNLVGLPSDVPQGLSLVPLARGEGAELFTARPQAFGRPLYGRDGWGVVTGEQKWWQRSAISTVFDVGLDPRERSNLAATTALGPYPEALAKALGTDVVLGYRFRILSRTGTPKIRAETPLGWRAVVPAYDPRGRSDGAEATIDAAGHLVWSPVIGVELPSEFFAVPVGDASDCTGLVVTTSVGSSVFTSQCARAAGPPGAGPNEVLSTGDQRAGVTVELAWVPLPQGEAVPGFHPDLAAQLEELGYAEDDEP